jgi:sigma-B regulation protein RsbU (phosphoserine phosphatase)
MSDTYLQEDQQDLALAAELQTALLPPRCPEDIPHQAAAARNRMCRRLGGDFYDFIRLNDDQIALVVGDVVGHGVRAALLMAQVTAFFRLQVRQLTRPVELVAAINRMLLDLGDRVGAVLPCSLFYALIDAPSGICFYVNTGHPKPYLCDAGSGRTHPMGSHDFLLGVEKFLPDEMCHTFVPGQRMVIYTDGIADSANQDGERFGTHRLRELIADHAADTCEGLADAVFDAVADFRAGQPMTDDETIVVVDRV